MSTPTWPLAGRATRLVSPVEMREIEPWLRTEDLTVGCYEPDSGYCNPAETARHMGFAAGQPIKGLHPDTAGRAGDAWLTGPSSMAPLTVYPSKRKLALLTVGSFAFGVKLHRFMSQRFLGIIPMDLNAVLGRMSVWKRVLMRTNARLLEAPFNVPEAALPLPLEDLLVRINVFRSK